MVGNAVTIGSGITNFAIASKIYANITFSL